MRHLYSPRYRVSIDPNVDRDTGEVLPSLTRQEHKDECDINSILKRYETTGALPPERLGQFAYVPAMDFMAAQQILRDATEMFQALPVALRDMYDNDPAKYLDAYDRRDPKLVEAAFKHGVISQRSPTALDKLSEIASNTSKPVEPPKAGAGQPT